MKRIEAIYLNFNSNNQNPAVFSFAIGRYARGATYDFVSGIQHTKLYLQMLRTFLSVLQPNLSLCLLSFFSLL